VAERTTRTATGASRTAAAGRTPTSRAATKTATKTVRAATATATATTTVRAATSTATATRKATSARTAGNGRTTAANGRTTTAAPKATSRTAANGAAASKANGGAAVRTAGAGSRRRRAATGLRWSHVALNCRDQRATEEFYGRWFGFTRARTVSLGTEEIIFLRHGDVYLELFHSTARRSAAAKADGPPAPGVARHLAFQTDNLDEFLAKVGDAIPVSLGPLHFDDFIPGWRSVWLRDPDGVIVEVSQGYRDE
jgi:glyoxylase I family protein